MRARNSRARRTIQELDADTVMRTRAEDSKMPRKTALRDSSIHAYFFRCSSERGFVRRITEQRSTFFAFGPTPKQSFSLKLTLPFQRVPPVLRQQLEQFFVRKFPLPDAFVGSGMSVEIV